MGTEYDWLATLSAFGFGIEMSYLGVVGTEFVEVLTCTPNKDELLRVVLSLSVKRLAGMQGMYPTITCVTDPAAGVCELSHSLGSPE
jgi:hypothetical protein